MAYTWERATPPLNLPEQTIQAMIREYSHTCEVSDYKFIPSGCLNNNYVVTLTNGQRLLLRISNTKQSFTNEIAIANSVLAHKINIPTLYHYGRYGDHVFLIYEYVEGELLSDCSNPDNKQAYVKQAARSAAIIHSHTKTDIDGLIDIGDDLPPFASWYDIFMSNAYVQEVLGKKRLDQIKAILDANADILTRIEQKKALTHSDYRPENMIVNENGELYIIDWQSPMTSHIVTDIGQFFRNYTMFSEQDKIAFMDEYNRYTEVKLSSEDFICAEFRDLVNYLQLLGNCQNKPNMRSNMIDLIDRFIGRHT